MESKTYTLQRARETKNAVLFEGSALRSVYVPKSELEYLGNPKTIEVTVTAVPTE